MLKRVMIATPTYDGKVDVRYIDSLLNTLRVEQKDYQIIPVFAPNDANVCKVRNFLMSIAVEAEVDDLFWIDADMTWDAMSFHKILADPYDFISGIARLKQDEQILAFKNIPKKDTPDKDGILEVLATGMAFTKMSKKCYMSLYVGSRYYKVGEQSARNVFEYSIDDEDYTGEDITVCHKWTNKNRKNKIYVDTNVMVGHIGTKVYMVDIGGLRKIQ